MADWLDDFMRGISFSFFYRTKPSVKDVTEAWNQFYSSRTEKQNKRFAEDLQVINSLHPENAGLARYALVLAMVQGRQYSDGVPVEKILELSSGLAGIQKSEKQFPFVQLESIVHGTAKRIAAGEKISYADLLVNEISYLLS